MHYVIQIVIVVFPLVVDRASIKEVSNVGRGAKRSPISELSSWRWSDEDVTAGAQPKTRRMCEHAAIFFEFRSALLRRRG